MINLLMILLLIPVSGWAESKTYPIIVGDPVVHCSFYHDEDLGPVMEGPGCPKHTMPVVSQLHRVAVEDGKTILTCDENYANCEVNAPERFPCYQRMQHAMIILDRLLDGIETERIKVGGVVYNNMKRQWNEVLWECARKR